MLYTVDWLLQKISKAKMEKKKSLKHLNKEDNTAGTNEKLFTLYKDYLSLREQHDLI